MNYVFTQTGTLTRNRTVHEFVDSTPPVPQRVWIREYAEGSDIWVVRDTRRPDGQRDAMSGTREEVGRYVAENFGITLPAA